MYEAPGYIPPSSWSFGFFAWKGPIESFLRTVYVLLIHLDSPANQLPQPSTPKKKRSTKKEEKSATKKTKKLESIQKSNTLIPQNSMDAFDPASNHIAHLMAPPKMKKISNPAPINSKPKPKITVKCFMINDSGSFTFNDSSRIRKIKNRCCQR
jgi:hypothetical protein